MKILSFNPGHDGAFAYLEDGHLVTSIEAEKHSRYRHSPLSIPDVFTILGELKQIPDVLCRGGWWPGDMHLSEQRFHAGYHGLGNSEIIVGEQRLLGKTVKYFSSSHERSHLLCAFGMSNLPKGTPCYALLWEGVIGSFYKIDAELNLIKVVDVEGITFWTNGGSQIVNYPKQHSVNCTQKHQATAQWFKPTVRILKNMRNSMIAKGYLADGIAPSYFLEGLLYNVPNSLFGKTYQNTIANAINWVIESADRSKLVCANEEYYLLHESSPVTWQAEKLQMYLNAVSSFWNL